MSVPQSSAALREQPTEPRLSPRVAKVPSPPPTPSPEGLEERLADSLRRAREHLLALQHEEGYWWAELEANTTLTSEYLFLMHMLGRVDPGKERKIVAELKAEQRPDGGYWIYHGGPSELSTTIEAYVAMKMAGEDTGASHMRQAREFILAHGGLSQARVFTKIHLALMGLYDYASTPTLPAWVMLFPKRFRMSIYHMSSWARSCVVSLLIVLDKKPLWPPQRPMDIDELYAEGKENAPTHWDWDRRAWLSWGNLFIAMDRVLGFLEKRRWVPFRRLGLKKAERWILSHQDDEGDWGGIIPAMAYSLLALQALGYEKEHPVMRKGWEAIERFGIESEGRFRLQSCVSPVWDTALALWALSDAGLRADHPALSQGARWLLGKQIRHYGDWAVKNRTGRPGGWAFEFFNRYYPDCDDSSAVILALRGIDLGADNEYRDASVERARQWVLSMQCKGGGWGAFDVDNDQHLWNKIPFADHKAMLDSNTPDLTGRVLEMLGALGSDLCDPVVAKAVGYLLAEQEADGSWYGRWGVNYVYGTWAVLCGLRRVGLPAKHPAIRAGAAFLRQAQNDDGGWGEHCESYAVGRFVRAPSCPSQTAWALMGLLAAGEAGAREVAAGVGWLLDHHRSDGRWDEEQFTGTGFPCHFYIRYHLYRDCFPAMALGQYARALRGSR